MIVGEFDDDGRPRLTGRLLIERLGIQHEVWFLVDTGADSSVVHGKDAKAAGITTAALRNPILHRGLAAGRSILGSRHGWLSATLTTRFPTGTRWGWR